MAQKLVFRRDYQKILNNKSFFGDFDPFGDFDFIFGAAKLNLKSLKCRCGIGHAHMDRPKFPDFDMALCYFKMVIFAFRKLKVI